MRGDICTQHLATTCGVADDVVRGVNACGESGRDGQAGHARSRGAVPGRRPGKSQGMLDGVSGRAPGETINLGAREIYVHYGSRMATTKLRIPAAIKGTARNITTVSRLARSRRMTPVPLDPITSSR